MMNDKNKIPDWQLERYLLGELPPDLENRVRQQLAKDESAEARLAELKESNVEILSSYPPEMMSGQIKKRYKEKYGKRGNQKNETGRVRVRSFAYALSAAALILVFLFPLRNLIRQNQIDRVPEQIRMKGAKPHLVVYRKSGDEIARLQNGDKVREQDILQLSYVAASRKYGVIYSIDGRGVVTVHYPDTHTESTPELDQSGEISLAYAYELDDAPSFERFFFVTSNEPFEIAMVEKAIKLLASKPRHAMKKDLKLPSRFRQYSIILNK
jgi:hypothetical protein